ncbi:MAG: hypothetical protein KF820_01050 [Candidatus Paracaedibacteraceae bacterium]|nr:hypothetical protein [Candidatus Paracaedibacteraceae bacterium]
MVKLTLVVLNLTTAAFSLDSDSDGSCFSLPAGYRTPLSNEATIGSSTKQPCQNISAPTTHKRSASTGTPVAIQPNDTQLEIGSKRTGSMTSEQFQAMLNNTVPLSSSTH